MKTKRLFESLLSSGSSSRTTAIAALIGGLAAGAVIGVLFAPDSGKAARQKLCDSLNGIFGRQEEDEEIEPAHPHNHHHTKRPKSNIKELIHQAHVGTGEIEQDFS